MAAVVPLAGTPPPGLGALLDWLRNCPLVARVVLVDDGSADGGAAIARLTGRQDAEVPGPAGPAIEVIRRDERGGPAAARNEVLALASTPPLVLFVDADTAILDEQWLERCVAHFADDRVAAVAPRIVTRPDHGCPAVSPAQPRRHTGRPAQPRGPAAALRSYEALESPLDLGTDPGLVGAGRRLSYVPSTALLVRTDVLREVGGWDEGLRFGEDVDLIRRIGASGRLVRYEPLASIGHAPRATLGDFARQRFGYGTAAAAIDARHPGTVAPLRLNPTAAAASAVVALAGAGWVVRGRLRPWAGLAVAGAVGATVTASHRLEGALAAEGCPDSRDLALRLAVRSTSGALAGLAAAWRRVWWPFLLPAVVLRRTRRRAVALLAAASLLGHARAAVVSGRPLTHLALGLADDCAYGAGVLAGCAREGSVRAIAPRPVRDSEGRRRSGHHRADVPDSAASESR